MCGVQAVSLIGAKSGEWAVAGRVSASLDLVVLLLAAQTLLLALHAEGVIEWSWPWVAAPLW